MQLQAGRDQNCVDILRKGNKAHVIAADVSRGPLEFRLNFVLHIPTKDRNPAIQPQYKIEL